MRSPTAVSAGHKYLENQVVSARMKLSDARPLSQSGLGGASGLPGSGIVTTVLALIAAGGVGILSFISARAAEPLVLTLMAVLATVGIFFLFGVAARHVRFGEPATSAEMLTAVIDSLQDGVQITDAWGRVVATNRAFRALIGGAEIGGSNPIETWFAGEPSVGPALFRLSRARERGERHTEEITLLQADGAAQRQRSFRLTVSPLDVPGTASAGRLSCWHLADISEQRSQQQEAVVDLQRKLAYFDHLPFGLLVARADGQVLHSNSRLSAWLGLPVDVHGRTIKLADLLSDNGAALIESLRGNPGRTHTRLDLDLVTETGRRWPGTLLVDHQDDIAVIGVLERAEEEASGPATRTSEQRFSRFFRSAPFGISMVDANGRIINSNAAFARLLLEHTTQRGADLAEVLAHGDPEIEGQVEAALAAAIDAKAAIAPFDITVGPKGKELSRRIYLTSLARTGAAGEVAILYVFDNTDQKALEMQVAQSQKMEAVGALAGGIAHDFNNVLTAIIGFTDLLLQTHKPGHPSYKNLASIKSSANRAAGLVRQLLAFSRRQTLQPRVLQLGDVMTDLSVLLNQLLGEKIDLKIVTGREPWYVKADRTQFEQVMINLSVNARDAMLPDGGRLTVRIRNVSERESQKLESRGVTRGEYVLIEVEDSGVGMPPEVLEKVFEPFFTTKAIGKGTGLGLATVYGIVKQTGGYILPESAPGKGTTFRLYLPRHELDADEEVVKAQNARRKKQAPRDLTGTGRILLVEDEDAVRMFAVEALRSKGYEVLQAQDGVEAIEVMAANGNKVDLVVSDVIMPEMDGPTLLKELRKTNPKLKFIFVSGYPDDAFKNTLAEETDFAFLPKPYSLAQIAEKVKEQMGR